EENTALELSQPGAGGAGGVTHGRARLVQHAMARQPRAPAEIDVLEVGEIVIVEATDGEKRLAAGDHVAAAGEEKLIAAERLAARSDRISKSILKRVTVEGHHAADEVDQLSAHVDDLSADGDHIVRSLVDGLDERRQPAGFRDGVIVEQCDVARLRSRHAGHDAASESM